LRKTIPFAILSPLVLLSCLQDPTAVFGRKAMEVQLHLTGGVAAVDYVVALDGEAATLTGVSCVNLCEFQEGDLLQRLTGQQVEYLWELFQDAAILSLDGDDFGTECCDQFYVELEYRDGGGNSAVRGTLGLLPPPLELAVATLQGMVSTDRPLIVDFDTAPGSWPRDSYQIQGASIQGDHLMVNLAYGGGCRTHDVQGVAWGGWMESDPVQVRVFLSHDDFDDPCDAWLTVDLRFDLASLRSAYRESYGTGAPGETTLVVLLEDPMIAGPLGARWLEYTF